MKLSVENYSSRSIGTFLFQYNKQRVPPIVKSTKGTLIHVSLLREENLKLEAVTYSDVAYW